MGVSISSHGDRYIITEIMDKGSIFDLIHPNLSFSAIRNPDTDNDVIFLFSLLIFFIFASLLLILFYISFIIFYLI